MLKVKIGEEEALLAKRIVLGIIGAAEQIYVNETLYASMKLTVDISEILDTISSNPNIIDEVLHKLTNLMSDTDNERLKVIYGQIRFDIISRLMKDVKPKFPAPQ